MITIEQESLHRDLKPYLEKGRLFPMLRHPLVYSVPYYEGMNQLLNQQYEMKLEMIKEYVSKGDWFGFVYAHERPYRLYAFSRILEEHKISDKEYWELLGDIWTDSENIWSNKAQWKKLLNSKRSGKENFMSEEDRKSFENLPDTIIAYRGYVPGKNKSGFSFSLDREKAEWFANRFKQNGMVSEVRVSKNRVFAYLNSRNEQEVIILS